MQEIPYYTITISRDSPKEIGFALLSVHGRIRRRLKRGTFGLEDVDKSIYYIEFTLKPKFSRRAGCNLKRNFKLKSSKGWGQIEETAKQKVGRENLDRYDKRFTLEEQFYLSSYQLRVLEDLKI